jgi:hypothetical protein
MEITTEIKTYIDKGISYKAYFELTENLVKQGKTTGPNQSEFYVNYTKLNFQRMKRLNKTIEINTSLIDLIKQIQTPQNWLVISESWCGDAAQNIPILQKIADFSPFVNLKIVFRDENLELIDRYLTNGGRSIPKLIAFKSETLEELFTWGPRPERIQNLMNDLKKANVNDVSILVEKIQIAYNADKCQSIQKEFEAIISGQLSKF